MIKQQKLNFDTWSHWFRLVLPVLAVAFTSPAWGTTVTNVNIVNFAFSPPDVTITVNDSVTWTWVGSPHTTTSDTGLWDSGTFGAGATYTRAFTSAGAFPYHCTIHPFMVGTITVQSVHVPPQVAITSPTNGSTLAAPATLTLSANASETGGTVTNVQFLQGTVVLTNLPSAPYSETVKKLAAGDYTFSAVASDDGGARATNTVTIHVVAAVPLLLSIPRRTSPGTFQFNYTSSPGLTYFAQRSTDLVHWIGLTTNAATAGISTILDTNADGGLGFYQVGLLPNP